MYQIRYILSMKSVVLHPKAREVIRDFPADVRDRLGQALLEIQKGFKLGMPRVRPMPSVAPGIEEIRLRGKDGIYRVFYFTRDPRGVLVFHAFMKKSQQTPRLEIELGKKRLKELQDEKK